MMNHADKMDEQEDPSPCVRCVCRKDSVMKVLDWKEGH